MSWSRRERLTTALQAVAVRWQLSPTGSGPSPRGACRDRFHWAIRHVTVTGAMGLRKPDTRTFHDALQSIGVDASNAAHVGHDPYRDVHGAQASGMRSIWWFAKPYPIRQRPFDARTVTSSKSRTRSRPWQVARPNPEGAGWGVSATHGMRSGPGRRPTPQSA